MLRPVKFLYCANAARAQRRPINIVRKAAYKIVFKVAFKAVSGRC